MEELVRVNEILAQSIASWEEFSVRLDRSEATITMLTSLLEKERKRDTQGGTEKAEIYAQSRLNEQDETRLQKLEAKMVDIEYKTEAEISNIWETLEDLFVPANTQHEKERKRDTQWETEKAEIYAQSRLKEQDETRLQNLEAKMVNMETNAAVDVVNIRVDISHFNIRMDEMDKITKTLLKFKKEDETRLKDLEEKMVKVTNRRTTLLQTQIEMGETIETIMEQMDTNTKTIETLARLDLFVDPFYYYAQLKEEEETNNENSPWVLGDRCSRQ